MFKLVVLCSVLALSAAKPGYLTPLVYSAVPASSSFSEYSTSVVHGSPLYTTGVYSTPYLRAAVVPAVATLSQAPNTPAVVLDAVNGVPLDTPEVVAARAAHYQAKALSGLQVHHLKKRSLTPLTYNTVVTPVSHSAYLAPLTYSTPYLTSYPSPALVSSPLTYTAVVPKAYGIHAWKK